MASNFYFQYKGGKRCEVKYIDKYINEEFMKGIKTIVEPFCGSCAFSLDYYIKKGYNLNYHVNDIDEYLINFLHEVKKKGFKPFVQYLKQVNFDEPDKDIRRKNINKFLESKSPYDYYVYKMVNKPYYVGETNKEYIKNYKDGKFKKSDQFFKNANLTSHDYKTIFEQYKDDSTALLFIDPPYFDSVNNLYDINKYSKRLYGREIPDNTQMFIDILELLKNCKCKVVGITNSNAIMNYLYKPYIKETFGKLYQMTKKKTEHILFTNF